MNQELEILEAKFNYFLNQIIIGASKDYYKKQIRYETRELRIVDDENYEEYLGKFVPEENYGDYCAFDENEELNKCVKLLSNIERTVIFLYFIEGYRTNEISRIVNMKEQSISRIKKRALENLRKYMKGFGKYEE